MHCVSRVARPPTAMLLIGRRNYEVRLRTAVVRTMVFRKRSVMVMTSTRGPSQNSELSRGLLVAKFEARRADMS